jgi:hypothetical protein
LTERGPSHYSPHHAWACLAERSPCRWVGGSAGYEGSFSTAHVGLSHADHLGSESQALAATPVVSQAVSGVPSQYPGNVVCCVFSVTERPWPARAALVREDQRGSQQHSVKDQTRPVHAALVRETGEDRNAIGCRGAAMHTDAALVQQGPARIATATTPRSGSTSTAQRWLARIAT